MMLMFRMLGRLHIAARCCPELFLAFRAAEAVCLTFVVLTKWAVWLDGHAAHRIVLAPMLVFLMLGMVMVMVMVKMARGGVHSAYFRLSSLGVSAPS